MRTSTRKLLRPISAARRSIRCNRLISDVTS